MKQITLYILIFCLVTSCDKKKEDVFLEEIDFFKIEETSPYYVVYIQNVKNDRGKLGLRGNVKSVKTVKKESDWEWTIYYEFNTQGRLVKAYSKNNSHTHTFYFNYENNRLINFQEEALVSMSGNKKENRINNTEIKYDANGRLKEAVYLKSGLISKYHASSYNKDGQLIQDGDISYKYDEYGRCIEKSFFEHGHDDDYNEVITYIYNDYNDIIEELMTSTTVPPEYAKDETPEVTKGRNTYAYEYDEQKNWVRCKAIRYGMIIERKRTIEYYDIDLTP